jgi:hypothetical protein
MKNQTGAQKLDSILLAILIVLMCSQLTNFALGQDTYKTQGYVTKQLFIAFCDIFLLLVFGWFCVRTTQLKAWKKLWWPPLPCWALIVAMIIAALHSPTIVNAVSSAMNEAGGIGGKIKSFGVKESKEAIADIIQFSMYFLIAPMVFVNLMHDRRENELVSRRRLALHAFSGALLLTTLIALAELLTSREENGPNALFSSPNAYAAFLALTMPFAVAHVLSIWNKPLPPFIATLVTVALAALTLISPWATLAITLGVLAAGAMLRQPARALIVLGLFFAATLGAWATSSTLDSPRRDFLKATSKTAVKKSESQPQATDSGIEAMVLSEAQTGQTNLKKQFIEWYAALGWSQSRRVSESGERSKNFATGVGPGNYQTNIGSYYDSLPNEEKMPPDSNNLYLVQATSLGALGLGALLWVALHFAGLANQARKQFPHDWLGAGVLASLIAAAFVNLFHALLVRGTGLTLAFLCSLAVIAVLQGTTQHSDESSV